MEKKMEHEMETGIMDYRGYSLNSWYPPLTSLLMPPIIIPHIISFFRSLDYNSYEILSKVLTGGSIGDYM